MTGVARSRFLVMATLETLGGRSVLEIADPDDSSLCYTLWPGLPPSELPLHPGLATALLVGRHRGEPVWIEARPEGVTLGALAGALGREQLCLVLLDLCDVLENLHAGGQAHGDLRASRVVIDTDGWVVLVGAGTRAGSAREDLVALVRMGRQVMQDVLSSEDMDVGGLLPDAVPTDAASYGRVLESSCLESPDLRALRASLGELVRSRRKLAPPTNSFIQVELIEGSQIRGLLDEVGVELGPEVDSTSSGWSGVGSWSGTASGGSTRTRPNAAAEVTLEASLDGSLAVTSTSRASRMQVLARVLAPLPTTPHPERFGAAAGKVCQGIRRLLEAESLEPLTVPNDVPLDMAVRLPEPLPPIPEAPRAEKPSPMVQRPWPAFMLGAGIAILLGLVLLIVWTLLTG